MTSPKSSPVAQRLQRHRRGVATRLDEIKAQLEDLTDAVRTVVQTSQLQSHKDDKHV